MKTLAEESTQALRYLESLRNPLPEESDTEFYAQNAKDYQALLFLNEKGLGATEDELKFLANTALSEPKAKRIVKRMIKIDALIFSEYEKQEKIQRNPKYWVGYYSGYEAYPTRRCTQLISNSENRQEKLIKELRELSRRITAEQAVEFGYHGEI